MNFNHLEYALEVAKAGSIRKASQNLLVSQPYLSNMIKSLEQELGYRIFSRTAAGITLTNKDERELNIASYYAKYIMETFLQYHNASTYKFSDKIREMGNEDVLEAVASGESAIGIIFYASEREKKYKKLIEKKHLTEIMQLPSIQIYVFLHHTHPLAQMSSIKAENLNDYPFVIYSDKSSRNYLQVLNLSDHPQLLEVSDRGGFYDALRSGEYLSIIAFWHLPVNGEFLAIPFQDKHFSLHSCCVTAKGYRLSKREKEFLEILQRATT